MNYHFGQKNNWRRWAWNAIVENLGAIGIKPRNATVLYFAGEQDLDRDVAISKGFRKSNLIAMENCRKTAMALRKKGTLTVMGDVLEIINDSSLGKFDVNVLIADFKSNISRVPIELAKSLPGIWSLRNSVCMFNVMAGRESFKQAQVQESIKGTHRGLIASEISREAMIRLTEGLPSGGFYLTDDALEKYQLKNQTLVRLNQYMSTKGQRFDSSVFVTPSIYALRNYTIKKHSEDQLQNSAIELWLELGMPKGLTVDSIKKTLVQKRSDPECQHLVEEMEKLKTESDAVLRQALNRVQVKSTEIKQQFSAVKATRTRQIMKLTNQLN